MDNNPRITIAWTETATHHATVSLTELRILLSDGAYLDLNPDRDLHPDSVDLTELYGELRGALAEELDERGQRTGIEDSRITDITIDSAAPGPTEPHGTNAPTNTMTTPSREQAGNGPRWTVLGLDEKVEHTLHVAAVVEGEHEPMDSQPTDQARVFRRWSYFVTADSAERAEQMAQELYQYGGSLEPVAAAAVRPGDLVLDGDGIAETVADRQDAGEQVLIQFDRDNRPTPYPRTKELMRVRFDEG